MTKPLLVFTRQAIENIKSNPDAFWQKMKENPDNLDWLPDFLEEDHPLIPTQYSFDFEFKTQGYESLCDSDFDNNVLLFNLLESYPRNVILSEQFLSGFLFTYGYSYFMNRWANTYKDDGKRVLSHIFFLSGQRRSITLNAIGHFLQQAYQLVDVSLSEENRFTLLKKAYQNPGVFMISYYTYADNPLVYRAFVSEGIHCAEQGRPLTTHEYRTLAKHLAMIQGVTVCETLTQQELQVLLDEFVELNRE